MLNNYTYLPLTQWLSRASTTPLLLHNEQVITTKQLKQQVSNLYQKLVLQTEPECILFFQDSYYFIISLLATLYAGKIPILLSYNNPIQLTPPHNSHSLLLTDHQLSALTKFWSFPSCLTEMKSSTNLLVLPKIMPDSYIVLYTSGSSGAPKRVEKTVATMDIESHWIARLWQDHFHANTVRSSVSHHHLYGLTFCIWLPLSMGYLIDTKIVKFPEQLNDTTHSIFITSPAFLQYLDLQLPSPNWSFIISAGGKLEYSLAEKIGLWGGVVVHEIYGSTETGVVAHREQYQGDEYWSLFPEVSLIDNGDKRYRLRSALLEKNSEFLLDDKISLKINGQFSLLGRTDKIIKIGEKRISISNIEDKLRDLADIADVAIVPIQRNSRTYLGAVIVLSQTTDELTKQQLSAWRHYLRQFVDPVAIPRFWRLVPVIPLNQQSKRSWIQLQELFNVTH